jgi:hypothetical protein
MKIHTQARINGGGLYRLSRSCLIAPDIKAVIVKIQLEIRKCSILVKLGNLSYVSMVGNAFTAPLTNDHQT